MNAVIEQINLGGRVFVDFAWPMLWQSGALISILLIVDFLLRTKVRAVFRYWLWMLVIIKLFLPTSLSTPVSIGQIINTPMTQINIAANVQPVGSDITNPVPLSVTMAGSKPLIDALSPVSALTQPATNLTWQGALLLAWLAVVVAMLLLLFQRVVFVCGLIRQSTEANDLMKDMLRFCAKAMGVKQTIGLKVSPNATSPAVCGLFRPVILVPQGLGSNLGSSHLRIVLMHELAHIKRGDLWINLLQTLLQIAYFYNPLLWLANWAIRRVREQAVDEAVQVALGEKANQYPETLLNVARLAFERPALSLRLIGVVESKSALTGRIKRMLTLPVPKTAKLGIIGSLAVVLFAAVLLPMAKAGADANETQANDTNIIELKHDDGVKVGMLSISGSGHCVKFNAPKGDKFLRAIKIYGSRYGEQEPPAENFHVWLCDSNLEIIKEFAFPYSEFKMRGLTKWTTLEVEPTQLPRQFIICVGFDPHQTKGIYVYYDGQSGGNSFTGLPGGLMESFNKGDWMIRAVVGDKDAKLPAEKTPRVKGPPVVVDTTPKVFANDVSPALKMLSVSFNQPMTDQSWSWTGGGETFPKSSGQPRYDQRRMTCTHPVEMEPGKVYWVGINSPSFQGFKSTSGVPVKWYVILFATRGADGKPTPIPQDLLDKAKAINAGSGQN